MPPYVYETPSNPYVGSIADLMRQQGRLAVDRELRLADIRMQRDLAKADLWARSIAQIAQMPSQIVEQRRLAAQQRMVDAMNQQRLELQQRELDRAREGDVVRTRVGMIANDPSLQTQGLLDPTKVSAALNPPGAEGQGPVDPLAVQGVVGALNQNTAAFQKQRGEMVAAKRVALAAAASDVLQEDARRAPGIARVEGALTGAFGPAMPGPVSGSGARLLRPALRMVDQLEQDGWVSGAEAALMRRGMQQDPASIKPGLEKMAGVKQDADWMTVAPRASPFNKATGTYGPQAPPAPEKPATPGAPVHSQSEWIRVPGVGDVLGSYVPGVGGAEGKLFYNGQDVTASARRIPPPAGGGGALNEDRLANIKEAPQGVIDGTLPPQRPGRTSADYRATLAEAHRQGYDLVTAVQDWTATAKYLQTLNGAQQTRLRQAADTAYHSLDIIDDLAKQWDAGRFPILNKANLAAAVNGAYGTQANKIATLLQAQIGDLTSELGNVYMGGNSPTDHALELAAKNLSGDWSKDVLLDATALARMNLRIRLNSMNTLPPAGLSDYQ